MPTLRIGVSQDSETLTNLPGQQAGDDAMTNKLNRRRPAARRCARQPGARGRQGHAPAQMGDPGAIRRLLRRHGQGLLQGRRPRRHHQSRRARHRAGPGDRRRRRRRHHRLDALGAGLAREGRAAGQHRAAVQAVRPRDSPAGPTPASRSRPTSRARPSASGSSATSIRSCRGCRSSTSRPTARPAA